MPYTAADLPNPTKCAYVDIETDNLRLDDVTKIHAICIEVNGIELRYSTLQEDVDKGHTIDKGIDMLATLAQNDISLVFHNGAGYDLGVLYKFYPDIKEFINLSNTVDTMLLSCIMRPERKNHSLASYGGGDATDEEKIENHDWNVCTENVVLRCMSDNRITKAVYESLYTDCLKYGLDNIYDSLTLESAVSRIHQKQWNRGVQYDLTKALEHWNYLKQETDRLRKKITDEAPWTCSITGVSKKDQVNAKGEAYQFYEKIVRPFKMNGEYTANSKKFWGDDVDKVKGEHVRVEFSPLRLSNSEDVKEYLLSLGWKPTDWNYTFRDGRKVKTSPKLTEESYVSLPQGLGQDIAKYNTLMHRMRSILNVDEEKGTAKGAVTNIRDDGRISAEAIVCGTPTARYRHMKTVCNIPRPSSVFGKEIRETFCVPADCLLLGLDLSGIEARMLAHYLSPYKGSEPIIKAILSTDKGSDFHSRNAKMWGVDRDTAKSGLYALMYGCFPKKLATTLGYDEAHGQKLYDDFWKFNLPIMELVKDLEEAYAHNGGWITGLDGRPLFVRERRKLLNTLLQNAATMVFKRWMVMTDDYIVENNSTIKSKLHQIIAYHDELQLEMESNHIDNAHMHAKEICKLALRAGEYYDVRVPTPADYKIGMNWAQTH